MSTPLNDLQRKFVKYCAERHNVCLVSMAGTGKSTAPKTAGDILKFSGKTVQFLASTGIASLKYYKGETIHRLGISNHHICNIHALIQKRFYI